MWNNDPASKEEFVQDHFHQLFGIVCDAIRGDRKGAELSMWQTMMSHKIETELRNIFDEFHPPNRPEVKTPDNKPTGPMKSPGR